LVDIELKKALTYTEVLILKHVRMGKKQTQIAEDTHYTISNVSRCVKSILNKMVMPEGLTGKNIDKRAVAMSNRLVYRQVT